MNGHSQKDGYPNYINPKTIKKLPPDYLIHNSFFKGKQKNNQ